MEGIRCLYNVKDEDLDYLGLGYSQMGLPPLKIADRLEDTAGRLRQMLGTHLMMQGLEESVALWLLGLMLTILCLFPFNFFSFGHIYPHRHLFLLILYLTVLLSSRPLTNASVSGPLPASPSGNRQKKLLVGWAVKADLVTFVLLLLVTSIIMIHLSPALISPNHDPVLKGRPECRVPLSYYHNPKIQRH